MDQEYNNFLKIKQIEQLANNYAIGKNLYELLNIIERWLLSNANNGHPFTLTQEVNNKLSSEMQEKHISDGQQLLGQMIHIINQPNVSVSNQFLVLIKDAVVTMTYGEFSTTINLERYNILKQYGTNEQIAICAMRYAAVLPRGQHWAVPLSEYKELVKDGYDIEAFTSPFNSQILRIGPQVDSVNRGLCFCSLFPDVDAIFGSIGSYFNTDLSGQSVIANPPFVEHLMNNMAVKIEQEIEKNRNTRYSVRVPNWLDAQYYQILENSKYLINKVVHRANTYMYEDLLNTKTIPARFSSTTFYLSGH